MRRSAVALYLLVLAFSAAILYGSSYQQFRYLNLDNPGGASDGVAYVEMSEGKLADAESQVRYRWITPAAARLVRDFLGAGFADPQEAIKLSFFLVNFCFSIATCLVFFALLRAIGLPIPYALLGVCSFASSRITVLVTATPLVDAAYLLAVLLILYLTMTRRAMLLAFWLPVAVLTKETVLPFLLLPMLTELRMSRAYWASLCASLAAFNLNRFVVDGMYPNAVPTLAATVGDHVAEMPANLASLFTWRGLHDLQNGFSLLLLLAVLGALANRRRKIYAIPGVLLAAIPLGFLYGLMSGTLGRMFFTAFPVVIAYAMIYIEQMVKGIGD